MFWQDVKTVSLLVYMTDFIIFIIAARHAILQRLAPARVGGRKGAPLLAALEMRMSRQLKTACLAAWFLSLLLAPLLPAHAEPLPPDVTIETYGAWPTGYPTAMVWAPDGRLFVNTKEGWVYQMAVGGGAATVWLDLSGVVLSAVEHGLVGIVFDPLYATQPYVYLYYSVENEGVISNRLVRFTEANGAATAPLVLLDVPRTGSDLNCAWHHGGNLHFGPDGYLYVTIGDYGCNGGHSQNLATPKGKMLRLDVRPPFLAEPNAARPAPNPLCDAAQAAGPVDRRVWACGLRNSWDFTFDSVTNFAFATENGPGCNDEINWILAGHNYGWPYSATSYFDCVALPRPYEEPIYVHPDPIGIVGITLFNSTTIPAWRHHLIWCANRDYAMYHAPFASARFDAPAPGSAVVVDGVTCPTDLSVGPDGRLYYLEFGAVSVLSNQGCLLPWDFDQNQVVDVFDVQQAADLWGNTWPDSGYSMHLDNNFDGANDVLDVQETAVHWGDACGGVAHPLEQ